MNKKELAKTIIPISIALVSLVLILFNYASYKRENERIEKYYQESSAASIVMDNILNGVDPFERANDLHGIVDGNTYDNNVIHISFKIPDGWNTLSTSEMQNYCESLNSYKRQVIDPNKPELVTMGDQYYDLICTDGEDHIISIIYVYYDNPNSTDCTDIVDYTLEEITVESQAEFDTDPNVTSATHDTPTFGFIDDQQVYLVNWTIHNSDDSISYRTEIIDYSNPCIRVIAIEYDDPSEFDAISSGISYYGGNEEPNTQNTIQAHN